MYIALEVWIGELVVRPKTNLFGSAETNNVLSLKLHFQSETIRFLKKHELIYEWEYTPLPLEHKHFA